VSLLAIGLGVLIIIAKNPVISILFLIGLFVNISMYLMLSGLFFMGLAYLLVYVGAVSILFIFILMLINVRVSELSTEEKNSIPLAILAVVSFNYIVTPGLPYSVYISELLPLHVLHI
jgi:NADH-ubiquinone oxidoreductase chain 6